MSIVSIRKNQSSWFSQPARVNAKGRHLYVRRLVSISAALMLLTVPSISCLAEEMEKKPVEAETSSQSSTNDQNQSTDNTIAKPKVRCMPKRPCPDTNEIK